MTEKPILLNSEMVRALLEGRKTQTRRVIRPQLFRDEGEKQWVYRYPSRNKECLHFPNASEALRDLCPYGQVGDRLWVREKMSLRPGTVAVYDADSEQMPSPLNPKHQEWLNNYKNHTVPSIHMPRWAARIFLEITKIRVERVQESLGDEYSNDTFQEGICQVCENEGVEYDSDPMGEPPHYCGRHGGVGCFEDYKDLFRQLWDSINAKRGYSWQTNPWVWVIEFKQLPERK